MGMKLILSEHIVTVDNTLNYIIEVNTAIMNTTVSGWRPILELSNPSDRCDPYLEWCEHNAEGHYQVVMPFFFYGFDLESDAVLFRLMWGG